MASDLPHVTKAELGRLMGASIPTVSQWVSKGCPYVQKGSKGKQWIFNVPDVVAWRGEQIAIQAVGDTKSLDIDEARRRKVAAEAALTELDLSVRRGELVEVEVVADTVGEDYANLRAKLLSFPVKLAPQVVGMEDAGEIQSLSESLIHEALEELVSDGLYERAAPRPDGAEEGESKTAT